jgi:molybdopterin/thiamine biosynthesis adenylyltransferase
MGRTLVVVGLGNIGSHLVPLLARMPEVVRLVLVDKGRYDQTNLRTQAITPGEVGRSKVRAQELRIRRIRPALEVVTMNRSVETVPLGLLRADAILACVDSRAARQYLNQAARHLGVPLLDAGVLPDNLLARVSVFVPGPARACLECTWDQADYDAIEQTYPCLGDAPDAASTGAPAQLGSLAAALQALECQSLLDGRRNGEPVPQPPASLRRKPESRCGSWPDAGCCQHDGGDAPRTGPATQVVEPAPVDGSYEFVIDAASHRQHVTRFVRNASCRLAEHEPWEICRLARAPEHLTVQQALALGSTRGSLQDACLSVDGMPFVKGLRCLGCGRLAPVLGLRRAITGRICRSCGGRLVASAAEIVPDLSLNGLASAARLQSLRSLGFEGGDVFTIRRLKQTQHFELDGCLAGTAER